MIPVMEVVTFLLVSYLAYTNAGTMLGFFLTVASLVLCYTIVRFIKLS